MRKSKTRTGNRPLKVLAAAAFASAAVLASTAVPALAGATLVLSTTQPAVAGGTVLYITGGSALVSTLGIRFAPTVGGCPTTYGDTTVAGTVSGGAITAAGDSLSAHVTTPPLPVLASAATYRPCLYATTAGNATAFSTDTFGTVPAITPVNVATLSPTAGQAADRVTLTASSAIYTLGAYSTEFVSTQTTCPATYTTPSVSGTAIVVGTTAKTSTSVLTVTVPTLAVGTPYLVCSYVAALAGSSALAVRSNVTFASFGSTLPTVTLNPTGGSSGTASHVTLSVPLASPVFTGTPEVLLTRNSCPYVRPADAALGAVTFLEPYAATVTKISTTKLALTIPTAVIVGGSDVTTPWNVCTYLSTSPNAALITAPALFSVAPVLDVTTALFAGLSTGSGPAQGLSQITISGLTGIPTATGAVLTASLGGSPINITTVNSSTSFTGTTSAHAAGAVNLTVTTAAGSKTTTGTPYSFTYGITLDPNTSPSTVSPVLDITGAGFGPLTFGDVVTATALASDHAYVLLTNNAWNAQGFGSATNAMITASPPTSACNTVLPISDTEIICTLDLANKITAVDASNVPTIATGPVPNGTYNVTVVNTGTALRLLDSNYSIVSMGSTFTVSPY
jgi:hypothetical protein